MSTISKNGILRSECYEGQQVSIDVRELDNMNDFLRYRLVETAVLRVKEIFVNATRTDYSDHCGGSHRNPYIFIHTPHKSTQRLSAGHEGYK